MSFSTYRTSDIASVVSSSVFCLVAHLVHIILDTKGRYSIMHGNGNLFFIWCVIWWCFWPDKETPEIFFLPPSDTSSSLTIYATAKENTSLHSTFCST